MKEVLYVLVDQRRLLAVQSSPDLSHNLTESLTGGHAEGLGMFDGEGLHKHVRLAQGHATAQVHSLGDQRRDVLPGRAVRLPAAGASAPAAAALHAVVVRGVEELAQVTRRHPYRSAQQLRRDLGVHPGHGVVATVVASLAG